MDSKNKGFSLIELMIALVLGLLLMAAIMQLFAGSKMTYNSNEAMARVQENIRFALNSIQGDVRGATTYGFCAAKPVINSHLNLSQPWQRAVFGAETEVMGWEFSNTGLSQEYEIDGDLPTASAGDWSTRIDDGGVQTLTLPNVFTSSSDVRPVAGSDILIIRKNRAVPLITSDGSEIDQTGADIGLTNDIDLQGQLVLVTDCNGADLFRNTSTTNNTLSRSSGGACGACPGNQSGGQWRTELNNPGIQVYKVEIYAYFIGLSTERSEPGLYRMNLSSCPCGAPLEELVDGIENMQVLYGVSPAHRTGGASVLSSDWYSANNVITRGRWWQVIGARVALLQRSPNLMGDGPIQREFDMLGASITHPLDARLRQSEVTTLSFRNRVVTDD